MNIRKKAHRFLSTRGRQILKTLLITMCADDPEMLRNVRLARVILRAERFVASLPTFYFILVKLSLYLMEYALPPLSWKIRPLSWMNLEARLKYLQEWQSSHFYPKRIIFRMASAVCLSHLYSEPRLLAYLGFETAMKKRASHQWLLKDGPLVH